MKGGELLIDDAEIKKEPLLLVENKFFGECFRLRVDESDGHCPVHRGKFRPVFSGCDPVVRLGGAAYGQKTAGGCGKLLRGLLYLRVVPPSFKHKLHSVSSSASPCVYRTSFTLHEIPTRGMPCL
jgi:hypothetical protein